MNVGDRFDRYVIERILGEGGMATVYLARHERLQSLHALKILRIDTPAVKERLLTEGKVQASLRHPNVVSVSDIIEEQGLVALVMEYVEGRALDELIDQDGPLPIEATLALFKQILLGVGAAHEHGMAHRDLKTANVLITTSNAGRIAKVTDFGIVKVVEGRGTQSGALMGTPEYMSPEQVRDSASVDARSDLWSLGVILYEMLSGELPFEDDDLLRVYNLIAAGEYIPLQERNPRIPRRLSIIVDNLLEPDLTKRIQTVNELLIAIYVPLEHADSLAYHVAPRPKKAAWSWGVVAGVLLVALFGLLVTLTGAGVWWAVQSSTPARDVTVALPPLPPGMGVRVFINGVPYGGAATLGPTEVATVLDTTWVVGVGCDLAGCPDACPPWCAVGEAQLEVPAGDDPWTTTLPIRPPTPGMLVARADLPLSRAELDNTPGTLDGSTARFAEVHPGRHHLWLESGTCSDADRDCGSRADCSPGCTSVVRPVDVGIDLAEVQIELPPPAALPVPEPVPVVPAPAEEPAAALPRVVSASAFASFLKAEPGWTKDAAIAAGRADAGYLRDWNPGPPAGSVTRVTWGAAKAYCASRGGLLPLDAEPKTWTSSTIRQEWRDASGKPSWRRSDGETSTAAGPDKAFPLMGFRCRR